MSGGSTELAKERHKLVHVHGHDERLFAVETDAGDAILHRDHQPFVDARGQYVR